jgi:hypothetical protein
VIDLDTLAETADGDRHDRLTALLIGLIAVLAATLAVVQVQSSLDEARHGATARRLAAELTTRLIASGSISNHQLVNAQRALMVSMEGTARQIEALSGPVPQPAELEVGLAQATAGDRLTTIAAEMGAAPSSDSPLDPWARDVLASRIGDLQSILAVQNRAADEADLASARSGRAVMGLSVVALAGVLVGLAAVVGGGRSGRALLLLAWVAAAGALALLLLAADLLSWAGGSGAVAG